MKLRYTSAFQKKLSKYYKKNPGLRKKVVKQVSRFQQNPQHPSLKMHKLAGKRSEQFSFWIEGDLRIAFVTAKDVIIFTDILTHDEY